MRKVDDEFLFRHGDKLLRGIPLECVEILRNTPVRVCHIDERLTTAWQNFCAQVQGKKTRYWEKYVSRIRQIISGEVHKLSDMQKKALTCACRDALFIGDLTGPFDASFFASETAFVDVIYQMVYHEATIDEDEILRAVVPMEPWTR